MKRVNSRKALSILLVAFVTLTMVPLLTIPIEGATEAEIETAIERGVEWLAADQEIDGSWPLFWEDVATTGLAVLKLEHRAYELGYVSPFDPDYEYHGNVTAGLNYLFSKLLTVEITPQDHTAGATGTVDDPDYNVNGLGVYAHGHTYPFDVYDTGIVLSAISASGTPDRVVNVVGSPVNGWKYSKVAQDMVDWLAWAQSDFDYAPNNMGEGGWSYGALDNDDQMGYYGPDNSNSGYAVLGLGYAIGFGCTVPQWVKMELNDYVVDIQDPVDGDPNGYDGGSWYHVAGSGILPNILKTGNLIFEMALVGDSPTTTRVVDALDYLARHWSDASGANWPPGWDGNPAQYQAIFCAMKGLEYMGVDTFSGIDWYADFSDKIVAQQCTTPGPNYGSWQQSSGRGNPTIITAWALLTLEKTAPPRRDIDKKVYVELLKNGDFNRGLDCWTVRVEKLHEVRTYDGPTWLAIRPLGPGWTDIKLVNEPGRTNVLDIIQAVSDGDGDWTGAIQTVSRDVSGFSELYFEADGKAMFQSLAGDGWVGGEYPVHFVITYTDVNGVDHDAHVGYPPSPAWQQGFYYLAGNLPNEPYSNQVTQNVWFHYKSPNLMNLSPAPKTIKTVRLYSSGWAYHGRIDNAELYGTPPSAELGDVIHVELEVNIPPGETATVVDTLPTECAYIDGTFTVDGVPATPTITKNSPPPPIITEISYTITEPGKHLIEFDCKVDTAYWEDREVCNVATATWYSGCAHAPEYLYVDGFTAEWQQWTEVGASPFLDTPDDGNYIEGTTDCCMHAWFTFEDFVLGCAIIDYVQLEGYTDGPYNEMVDFDVYTKDFVWLGSLYATGAPAWVTPRWVGAAKTSDLEPALLTQAGINDFKVLVHFYDPDGYGGEGNILDALRLHVVFKGEDVVETKEDVECFIIHPFEDLQKNVGMPKKVKVIPAPVQFWREFIGGVTDIIVFDPPEITEGIALVRDYAVLHSEGPIPLELLTWEGTEGLPWEEIDKDNDGDGIRDPYILAPDEVAEYDIYTDPIATAVLVRYTVAWASSQDVIEAHFINEAILESRSPQVIVGQLTNFDVHNDYHEPVDNFELELYGIEPSDIVDWFPGWGAPPEINSIPPSPDGTMPAGTEIIWMEPTHPIMPCEWEHFGLHLKPGVIAVGIKAYWTQTAMGDLTIKEKTEVQWTFVIEVHNPFCYTMQNVMITDNLGAELGIDEIMKTGDVNDDAMVDIMDLASVGRAFGTAMGNPGWSSAVDLNKDDRVDIDDLIISSKTYGTWATSEIIIDETGASEKVHLTWYIGSLAPCETARLILLVSTDLNPAGHQEYTEPGIYEMNSGATLKFIDPLQDTQLSAVTNSIYITVLPEEDC